MSDLISRSALYRKIKTECNPYGKPTIDFESGKRVLDIIDNAPTVEPTFGLFKEMLCSECEKRPQGEWLEIKHRLNLLIGVLYSNQLISQSDFDYMEDSIKKLMKGGAE